MKENTTEHRDEKSVGSLVSKLTTEINTLFHQEINLVKTEMSEKVGQAQSGVINITVGGAVAYAGLLFLLWAIVLGLSLIMDGWLAALIVGAVVLIVGISMINSGKSKLKANNLMPQKSFDQLEKDKDMAKEHVSNKTNTKKQPSL